MTWEPLHPKHAIERTRVIVQFSGLLPQKAINSLCLTVEPVLNQLEYGASRDQIAPPLGILDSLSEDSRAIQSRGWRYSRETASGEVYEALVINPDSILYETFEYVRWASFWEKASRLIYPLVERTSEIIDCRAYALEYFDRFIFSDSGCAASPINLINDSIINTMPQSVRDGTELWHIHRGWFQNYDGLRVLVNQNIDAFDNTSEDKLLRNVGIYTKIERRDSTGIVNLSHLGGEVERIHTLSKSVFASALTEEMRASLGIYDV